MRRTLGELTRRYRDENVESGLPAANHGGDPDLSNCDRVRAKSARNHNFDTTMASALEEFRRSGTACTSGSSKLSDITLESTLMYSPCSKAIRGYCTVADRDNAFLVALEIEQQLELGHHADGIKCIIQHMK